MQYSTVPVALIIEPDCAANRVRTAQTGPPSANCTAAEIATHRHTSPASDSLCAHAKRVASAMALCALALTCTCTCTCVRVCVCCVLVCLCRR